jgi:antitoxin component of MazEF toxin-antitoxin module
MVKHLTRHGNSLALVIEKGVLELLRISATTPLEVATDGTSLVITPVRRAARGPSAARAEVPADRAAAVYAAAVRAMTLEQKLRVSEGLRDLAWQIETGSLRKRHPEWTPEELHRRVGESFLHGRA